MLPWNVHSKISCFPSIALLWKICYIRTKKNLIFKNLYLMKFDSILLTVNTILTLICSFLSSSSSVLSAPFLYLSLLSLYPTPLFITIFGFLYYPSHSIIPFTSPSFLPYSLFSLFLLYITLLFSYLYSRTSVLFCSYPFPISSSQSIPLLSTLHSPPSLPYISLPASLLPYSLLPIPSSLLLFPLFIHPYPFFSPSHLFTSLPLSIYKYVLHT